MKTLSLLAATFVFVAAGHADAANRVKGYQKKNGTYVQPHQRSTPNHSKVDNWSSDGNYNPYTGTKGTRDPYAVEKKKR